MIDCLQALWLAIVQGLTEFLPVSSSGHLVLFGKLLKLNTDGGVLFDVILHLGTLVVVIVVYRKDVWILIREAVLLVVNGIQFLVSRKKHPWRMYNERKLTLMVILACIPTMIIGLLVQKFLEDIMLTSLIAVGVTLMVSSLLLILSRKIRIRNRTVAKATYRDALVIGIVQGIATLPGLTRSGSTIVAGEAGGFDKEFAVKFSFLISLPAVTGAALLSFLKADLSVVSVNILPYMVGFVASAITGFFSLRFLRMLTRSNKLYLFGYYCGVLGILAIMCGILIR